MVERKVFGAFCIAVARFAYRHRPWSIAVAMVAAVGPVWTAQPDDEAPAPVAAPAVPAAPSMRPPPVSRWMTVPAARGRLTAVQIGLVVNTADPYSVAVGAYYARRRGLAPAQVLNVELPPRAALTEPEF